MKNSSQKLGGRKNEIRNTNRKENKVVLTKIQQEEIEKRLFSGGRFGDGELSFEQINIVYEEVLNEK